jgi:TonB family protein
MITRIGATILAMFGAWLTAAPDARAAPDTPTESLAAQQKDLSSVVLACVDKKGKLLSAQIARSSGYPEIDQASLKVARAAQYAPAQKNGKARRRSCVKFKVQFVLKDGEVVPAAPRGPAVINIGA